MRTRVSVCFIVLTLLMAALFVLDLCLGQVNISVSDVWASLTGGEVSRPVRPGWPGRDCR